MKKPFAVTLQGRVVSAYPVMLITGSIAAYRELPVNTALVGRLLGAVGIGVAASATATVAGVACSLSSGIVGISIGLLVADKSGGYIGRNIGAVAGMVAGLLVGAHEGDKIAQNLIKPLLAKHEIQQSPAEKIRIDFIRPIVVRSTKLAA